MSTILLVDDSPMQRFALESLLEDEQYEDLLLADSAVAAFEILNLEQPEQVEKSVDLILMDISMPDIDGIAACNTIKKTAGLENIPIIMVTSSTNEDDLRLAFAAGAMDYITKPPNAVELLARVRSALQLKSEMDRRKARERELADVSRRLQETLSELDEKHRQLQRATWGRRRWRR